MEYINPFIKLFVMRHLNIIFLLIMLFALVNPAFSIATKYTSYDIKVFLTDEGIVREEVSIFFDDVKEDFSYYIIHKAYNIKIFAEKGKLDCKVKYIDFGTLISCEHANSRNFKLSFVVPDLIKRSGNLYYYQDKFVITEIADFFSLRVYLPEGYILPTNLSLSMAPFSPGWGTSGSDGRHIFVEWKKKPRLGDTYYVEVYFEKAKENPTHKYYSLLAIIGIFALLSFFFFYSRSGNKVIGYLNENERRVIDVIRRHGGKVSQKKICIETDFSKAQVSRILKDMEERGLIRRIKKGRSCDVILKV